MIKINPHKPGTIGHEAYKKAGYVTAPKRQAVYNPASTENTRQASALMQPLLLMGFFGLLVFVVAQLVGAGMVKLDTDTRYTPTARTPVESVADFVSSQLVGGSLIGAPQRCKDSHSSTRNVYAITIQGHNAYGAVVQQGAIVATIDGVRQLIKDTDEGYSSNVTLCK